MSIAIQHHSWKNSRKVNEQLNCMAIDAGNDRGEMYLNLASDLFSWKIPETLPRHAVYLLLTIRIQVLGWRTRNRRGWTFNYSYFWKTVSSGAIQCGRWAGFCSIPLYDFLRNLWKKLPITRKSHFFFLCGESSGSRVSLGPKGLNFLTFGYGKIDSGDLLLAVDRGISTMRFFSTPDKNSLYFYR